MSIMDDYSRKLWVFLMKSKSEVFDIFKNWCLEVENEKECKVKCVRTDNEMEFLSTNFKNFCKEKGILRQTTIRENPQQNGIEERMNRTLLERVRCLLIGLCLPKSFFLGEGSYLYNSVCDKRNTFKSFAVKHTR